MLRQANNVVKIEGILSQINLNYGSYVQDGSTVENIGGSINVKVDNGTSVLDIPVYMFAKKYTKTGALNPAFTSIETVMKEFVSIAACGNEAGADKIRINKAEVRMNEFPGRDGRIVAEPRITANFVNKAFGTFTPGATFSLEFAVQNMAPVVDREGVEVEPKKVNVTALVPQWGGLVDVVTLTAASPVVIDAIETHWEIGKCYTANGIVNFTSTTEEYEEHVDFGEPIKKVRTRKLNEFIITSGTQDPMDESMGFAAEDIQAGLNLRASRLEERKAKATKEAPAPAQTTLNAPFDLGF